MMISALTRLFARKPRFCGTCGRQYVRLPHHSGFSTKTGEPWTKYEWRCPRAHPSDPFSRNNDCWDDPPAESDDA
jgi:hypothetical protein